MGETAKERTHWRDQGISEHHRKWGVECQATDLDFVLLEYRCEYRVVKPVAIIEYKKNTAERNDNLLAYDALRHVSNCADLPFFVVRYSGDFKKFLVIAMNDWAKIRLRVPERNMNEETYVTFLYRLRGYDTVPQKVWDNIRRGQQNLQFG